MSCYLKLNQFAKTLKDVDIGLQQKEKPVFEKDQVLLRVLCSSLNTTDLYSLTGTYGGFQPKVDELIPGMECVSIVEDIGSEVSKVEKGQRVVPILMPELPDQGLGSWQEYLVLSEDRLIIVPEGVSDETAAQFFVNHFTPYALIKNAKIPKGEWLLQNAASGLAGRQIIKLAKHFGLNVVNLVRHNSQIEELEKFGAENILCTEGDSEIIRKIVKITSAKLGFAGFDAIGGDNGVIISNGIAEGKTAYLYGLMGGPELKAFSHSILFRGVSYEGFWIVRYLRERDFSEIVEDSNILMGLIKDGVVDSLPGIKMEFSQIKEALAAAQSPSTSGKVLLVPKFDKKDAALSKDNDVSELEKTFASSLEI